MAISTQPTLGELFQLPETVHRGDFVLNLAEVARPGGAPDQVLDSYVITEQIKACFQSALDLIKTAVSSNRSKATFLHGSFGSGKSHFMAVLYQLLSQDPRAKAKPELQDVSATHSWIEGKKFLLIPYHFLTQPSLETCILGGYVDFVSAAHPGATLPPVYRADKILANAESLRQQLGEESFLPLLGQATADDNDDDGWGELAEEETSEWTIERYKNALQAGPKDPERQELVSALLKRVLTFFRQTEGREDDQFVRIDEGLTLIAEHAKGLGYDGLVLFCDELILWLAGRSANTAFVQTEVQKVIKLVEGQVRAIPVVSFIAQQRDLRELMGDQIMGHEQKILDDCFRHWEGRFETITLEDRNLPEIAAKRVLRAKSEQTRRQIDQSFEHLLKANPQLKGALLTENTTEEDFRKLYPFSPALMETLVAVSSMLQRERTALKVLLELLIEKAETHRLGDIIPVGDLYEQVAEGAEAFSPSVKNRFNQAHRFYQDEFIPFLEEEVGIGWRAPAQGADEMAKKKLFQSRDRLMKTLLLATLTPEVPALKNLTVSRLLGLNHGAIQTPIPHAGVNQLQNILSAWTTRFGQLKLSDDKDPKVSLELTGVDIEPLLAEVSDEANTGNRRREIRRLLFQALELNSESDSQTFSLPWRGVKRKVRVGFANIRDLELDQLQNTTDEWQLLIDYPFDESNHTPRDDTLRLAEYRESSLPPSRLLAWMPSFLSDKANSDLGDLVKINHLLTGSRLEEFTKGFNLTARQEAAKMLKSRGEALREQLDKRIQMAYGVAPAAPNALHPQKSLEREEQFATLWEGFQPAPPVANGLRQALEKLLASALEYQFPKAPKLAREVRGSHLQQVWEELETAARSQSERHFVESKERRKLLAEVAEPIGLGEMKETYFVLSEEWVDRFNRILTDEDMTVERLEQSVDSQGATGLTSGLKQLLILYWAHKTHHGFKRHGRELEGVSPGELEGKDLIFEQDLPQPAHWEAARSRAEWFFQLEIESIRNPQSVARCSRLVRQELEKRCQTLTPYSRALKQFLHQLGVEKSNRHTTAKALATLFEESREQTTSTGLVTVFGGKELTPSLGACKRLLERLAKNSELLANDNMCALIAQLDPSDQAICSLHQALTDDEIVTPLEPKFRSAFQSLQRKVQAETTSAKPSPKPKGSKNGEILTSVDNLSQAMEELREELGSSKGTLRIHWTLVE